METSDILSKRRQLVTFKIFMLESLCRLFRDMSDIDEDADMG